MRTFKCSFLLIWLILCSSSAFAATASALINNFDLSVTNGSITQRDNSFVRTDATVVGDVQQNYSFTPDADFSFNSSTTASNATDTSIAQAVVAPNNPDSYLYAYTSGNGESFSSAQSFLTYAFDYQANTTVTLSVDALLEHQPDSGSDYLAYTRAVIRLYDTININDYYFVNVFEQPDTTQPYSSFQRISTTFVAPIDTILIVSYDVRAVIGIAPVTPVPEPETYAMMLAGLGLIGFIGKRKSKK